MRQQGFGSLITGYIDSTSLAQRRVVAHQECKSQRELSVRDFQSRVSATAENKGSLIRPCLQGELMLQNAISTASSGKTLVRCGFGWKAKLRRFASSFFSHRHQICGLLLHSLCTMNRRYPSLFARYPKLPQASAATTVFI